MGKKVTCYNCLEKLASSPYELCRDCQGLPDDVERDIIWKWARGLRGMVCSSAHHRFITAQTKLRRRPILQCKSTEHRLRF